MFAHSSHSNMQNSFSMRFQFFLPQNDALLAWVVVRMTLPHYRLLHLPHDPAPSATSASFVYLTTPCDRLLRLPPPLLLSLATLLLRQCPSYVAEPTPTPSRCLVSPPTRRRSHPKASMSATPDNPKALTRRQLPLPVE
jgi:hypothetical protein